jgi:hypothetical protein
VVLTFEQGNSIADLASSEALKTSFEVTTNALGRFFFLHQHLSLSSLLTTSQGFRELHPMLCNIPSEHNNGMRAISSPLTAQWLWLFLFQPLWLECLCDTKLQSKAKKGKAAPLASMALSSNSRLATLAKVLIIGKIDVFKNRARHANLHVLPVEILITSFVFVTTDTLNPLIDHSNPYLGISALGQLITVAGPVLHLVA